MMPMFTFVVYLLLLSVGKSPADIREFARLQGTWDVVGIEADGKQIPPKVWQLKKVVIAPAETGKEQPTNSVAYWGRLNMRLSRPTIESRFLTVVPPLSMEKEEAADPQVPPYPKMPPAMYGVESVIIYDIKGDTLRLLVTNIVSKYDKPPTKVETTADSRGVLFVLKRKSSP